MKYDAKEFKRYPEIMSKEQMRIACHISKRTALYLLQFNLIPHTFTGKKTRCYAIKKSDVIAFMNDREVNPEKYIAPKNWYKYGGEIVRPYKIRIQPPCAKDEKKLRRYYESKLAALPDVMDVAAAVDFTYQIAVQVTPSFTPEKLTLAVSEPPALTLSGTVIVI